MAARLDDGAMGGMVEPGEEETHAIRAATYSGRVLGCEEFVARLEAATKKKLTAGRPGRPKKEVRAVANRVSA